MLLLVVWIAFVAALGCALTGRMKQRVPLVSGFSLVGFLSCLVVFIDNYLQALPMMPMHLGISGVTAVLGLILCIRCLGFTNQNSWYERVLLLLCIILLVTVSILFPKDFYLPFIRSYSIWSHLFFLFGVIAKALLLYGGVIMASQFTVSKRDTSSRSYSQTKAMNFVVWGYGFLMVSMFSGEIWSYLGWGTPVVWQDPAITTTIALWFYWSCFLHLHYMKSWNGKRRAFFLVLGGLLVLALVIHPDMGPFRMIRLFG